MNEKENYYYCIAVLTQKHKNEVKKKYISRWLIFANLVFREIDQFR